MPNASKDTPSSTMSIGGGPGDRPATRSNRIWRSRATSAASGVTRARSEILKVLPIGTFRTSSSLISDLSVRSSIGEAMITEVS